MFIVLDIKKKHTLINLFRFVPTVNLLCDENKYFRFLKHFFNFLVVPDSSYKVIRAVFIYKYSHKSL